MNKGCWPLIFSAVLFMHCHATRQATAGDNPFNHCYQLVVVISPDSSSTTARMGYFTKKKNDWTQESANIPVMLGRSGLAWGRGLHIPQPGRQKREGDGKSPAGIFRFGTAFGRLSPGEIDWKLPYVQVTGTLECVDDAGSQFYNKIVDNQQVRKDWNSSERMWEVGEQYDWGVFVAHNDPAQPSSGSCIFLHVWGGPGVSTSGCTAMKEADLLELLRWLEPEKQPLLVQVTQVDYPVFQKKYKLPDLR